MNNHSIKKKLKENQIILGTWLTIPSTSIAEIICQSGFDWCAIDMEHSCMTLNQCEDLIRVIELSNVSPFVRLSNNDFVQIKRVMDAGAHGIIVPMVNSLADVKLAHQAMHYPPVGNRGVGLARAQKYGANFKGYWEWQLNEAVLIIQIEHKNSLSNLDEIFSSGLIDGYIIGPYDLSASLGVPGEFDHNLVKDALALVEEKAELYQIKKGIHLVEMDSESLKAKINSGYKVIAYGVDFRVLESNYSKAVILFAQIGDK
jgi:2-dehydro-3-deoxyglucarate aldolase